MCVPLAFLVCGWMQSDSTSAAAKDLDVALADDKIALIVDDTDQVWPDCNTAALPRKAVVLPHSGVQLASICQCREWG